MLGNKRKKNSKNENKEEELEKNEIKTPNSNKPLWIHDVKYSLNSLFPSSLKENDFEEINNLMVKEDESDIDKEDIIYFNSIKKIMFAFGDTFNSSNKTILFMENFIREFLINLAKILNECDFKKIIEHFFNYEYEKLHNYKKLKFRNNIIQGNDSNEESNDEENNKININNNNLNINNELLEENDNFGIDSEENNKQEKKNSFLTNKDDFYIENTTFQSERTEQMDKKQYEEYFNCRQHNFLSKGKKIFQNYLLNVIGNPFPNELKDFNNIELIAFILKEEIRKIITDSIKEKHPKKKLFILTQPLSVDDISPFCQREINNLTNFFQDFSHDIHLIKEFKKKSFADKYHNKNCKVKKGENGEIYLIIKKNIFISDQNENEFFKKRKNFENHVFTTIILLKDKLIKLKNEKSNLRYLRNSDKKDVDKYKNKILSLKDIFLEYGINNYYEYFLIKDLICEINIEEIKAQEIIHKISILNKVNKKKLSQKFDVWLKLTNNEKEEIKNQFENIMK